METRSLTSADLPLIQDVARHADSEGFRFVARFADECVNGRIHFDAPGEFFYGVFDEGQLLALGGVTRDPYVDDPNVGRVRHVFVRAEFRGRGVGGALVELLEARARNQYERLRLRTDTIAAAQFYEGLGFRAVSEDSATHERPLRDGRQQARY